MEELPFFFRFPCSPSLVGLAAAFLASFQRFATVCETAEADHR
jgi:hypothetical protein